MIKPTAKNTQHIVFLTEIGMKVFEYEVKNNEYKLIYCIDPLKESKGIQYLESDLKLIFMNEILNREVEIFKKKKDNTFIFKRKQDRNKLFFINSNLDKKIDEIKVKGALFTKNQVEYNYAYSFHPQNVHLKHRFVNFKITLSQISNEEKK